MDTLERIRALVDELYALSDNLSMQPTIALHGERWPEGVEPDERAPLAVCHGQLGHSVFRCGRIGRVEVYVSRPATEAETAAKKHHLPDCDLFRMEAYREAR